MEIKLSSTDHDFNVDEWNLTVLKFAQLFGKGDELLIKQELNIFKDPDEESESDFDWNLYVNDVKLDWNFFTCQEIVAFMRGYTIAHHTSIIKDKWTSI